MRVGHYIGVLIGVLLISITTIAIIKVDNNNLTEENKVLKEKVTLLEIENKNQQDTIVERNGNIYILENIIEELKQLYFEAIDFHPDESYPYK